MKIKSKIVAAVSAALMLAMVLATTAFAGSQPTVSVDNASPKAGDTITFTITTNNTGLVGNVTASANLEFVSVNDPLSDAAGFIVVAPSVIYTYKVKADAAGQSFNFTVSGLVGSDGEGDVNYADMAAGGTVAAAPESSSSEAPPVSSSEAPPASSSEAPASSSEAPASSSQAPAPSSPTTAKSPRTGVYA